MRRLLPALFLLLTATATATATAQTLDEYVVLVSGDTLRGDVDIKEPFFGSARVVLNDSAEYKLGDVQEVDNASGNYVVGHGSLFGGTVLVQRVEAGRISFYEKVTQNPGSWMPGPNGRQQFSGGGETRHEYFRTAGGPVQEASTANLRAAMQDNPEALALLGRRERLTYAQYGLLGAGILVAIVGATQSDFGEEADPNPFAGDRGRPASISPVFWVGTGVALSSVIPQMMRRPLLRRSIDTYNRDAQGR